MKKDLSEVELLDCAARTYRFSVFLLVITFMALSSVARMTEHGTPVLLYGLLAVGVLIVIFACMRWRYKFYALSVCLFASGIDCALSYFGLFHSPTSRAGDFYFSSFYCIYGGCWLWSLAGPLSAVYGKDGENQRNQIDQWLRWLRATNPDFTEIIEFAAGSFWTGYCTIRIMNSGNCWVIVKFKKGTYKVVNCRVHELNAVAFTELPGGKWKIELLKEKKTFTGVEIKPQMPASFMPFTHPASV